MRIDRVALVKLFEKLDAESTSEQVLCVIGAAAVLAHGLDGRQTQDIDVWRPASAINDAALARAAEAAGMDYNPAALDVERVFLQTILPGVVQLPDYKDGKWSTGEASETLWQGDKLRVVAPPPAIIVAAKLVRGEDRDIDDCAYLIEAKRIGPDQIRDAIRGIPDDLGREAAEENLVLVSVLRADADEMERPSKPRDDKGTGR